ncbi:MAG: hypothetical protein ACP5IT_11345 [Thermoproteota archaeon]
MREDKRIYYKKFEWHLKRLYEKYVPLIGSITTQWIVNKNNDAWRSFFKLKKLEAKKGTTKTRS